LNSGRIRRPIAVMSADVEDVSALARKT